MSQKTSNKTSNKPSNNPSNKSNSAPKTDNAKKKKYKFNVMDYITIGFTVVIVIVMIIFLLKAVKPEWFEKKDKGGTPTATQNAGPTDYTPVEQPTEAPYYTGIGNAYGNMSNDAAAAEIDGRTYRVNADGSGTYSIIVSDGESERVIVSGETGLSSISVIKDPFTFADVAGSVAYLVTFIDGSGNICAVTDGPIPNGSDSTLTNEDATATAKKLLTEGVFRMCVTVGENVYAIDSDGYIVKFAIAGGEKTTMSKLKYTALCVYFGAIYAVSQDGDLYVLTTTPRPAETGTEDGESDGEAEGEAEGEAVPGVDQYEMLIGEGQYRAIAVFDDWVYAAGVNGVNRYDSDLYGRDSLTAAFSPIAVNVDRRGIFLLVCEPADDGSGDVLALYNGTAKSLLTGKAELLAKFDLASGAADPESYRITLCTDYVLITSPNGGAVFKAELSGAKQ